MKHWNVNEHQTLHLAKKRAHRRWLEYKLNGDDISIEKVIENINFRDHNDETRKVSPLIRPKDSIEIDNTNLNIDQTFELAINHVQNHLNKGIGKNIN